MFSPGPPAFRHEYEGNGCLYLYVGPAMSWPLRVPPLAQGSWDRLHPSQDSIRGKKQLETGWVILGGERVLGLGKILKVRVWLTCFLAVQNLY